MKRTLYAVLVAAISTLALVGGAAIAADYRDTSAWINSSGTTKASITPDGLVLGANYRRVNGTTFTAADPNPSRATLRGASFFLVDTTANAVDLDFSDDADLEAADLGTEWVFLISAGGTNALTVTNGASGVAITTLNTLGTTCEDVGDVIRCTGFALEKALCVTTCAD